MKRLFRASTSRSHHISVRLACVRHAASVHPEPGSNSHVHVCPASFNWLLLFGLWFWISPHHVLNSYFWNSYWNFQGCIAVYLSRFCVAVLSGNSDIISYVVRSVNNFFKVFSNFFHQRFVLFLRGGILYYHIFQTFVNTFFKLFSTAFVRLSTGRFSLCKKRKKRNLNHLRFSFLLVVKRRKRDLNPRAGCPTYTLSRGASSASWVFLHNLNYVSTNMILLRPFVTQKLLYIRSLRLSIPFFPE